MSAGNCRTCDAPIRWVRSQTSGKLMPVDPEPAERGSIVKVGMGTDGVAIVAYLRKGQLDEFDDRPRYVSHFATCPDADEHRHASVPAAVSQPTDDGGQS